MSIDISLLPRADLPVIWEDFKAKAELVRTTAETLTVTNITQKDEMALARKTRLTLREIRIAVEHKRVELGEGHLKEIQKVNGAAKALREFIEPLEARLLHQESFAERVEADRIVALSKSRNDELRALGQGVCPKDLGTMEQADYDAYIAGVRSDKAEREAANRLRVEAERQLAEVRAEAQKRAIELQLELKAESDRLKAEAEAARILAQQERDAEAWKVQQERVAADGRLAEARAEAEKRLEEERIQWAQDVAVAEAKQRELKRVQDEQEAICRRAREKAAAEQAEQLAAAEEKLAAIALDAARVAAVEEKRLRDIACAPDVEKLRDFAARIQAVGRNCPVLTTKEAKDCFGRVVIKFNETLSIIQTFCRE